MTCTNRQELFEFAHRMLDAKRAAEVEEHVASCKSCRAVAEEFAKLDAVLDEWKTAEPSPWFDARVRARVESAEKGAPSHSIPWRTIALVLASAIVLAVGVVFVAIPKRAPHPPQAVAAGTKPPAPAVAAANSPLPSDATRPAADEAHGGQPPAALTSAKEEMTLYENLSTLEDYDMLANFDVLSDFPQKGGKVEN